MSKTRRPGAGRPKEIDSPVRISIMMEAKSKEMAMTVAKREGMTFSEYIRRAVDKALGIK